MSGRLRTSNLFHWFWDNHDLYAGYVLALKSHLRCDYVPPLLKYYLHCDSVLRFCTDIFRQVCPWLLQMLVTEQNDEFLIAHAYSHS
jgi:hypothetical protein